MIRTLHTLGYIAAVLLLSDALPKGARAQEPPVEIISFRQGLTQPGFFSIAVDADLNAYVSGNVSDNIFQIAPGPGRGRCTTEIFRGPNTLLRGPRGLAVRPDGTLFVTSEDTDSVIRIDTDLSVSEVADLDFIKGAIDSEARCDPKPQIPQRNDWNPTGIALDGAGNVYAAGTRFVVRIPADPSSQPELIYCGVGLNGVAVDEAGAVYVASVSTPASPTFPIVIRIGDQGTGIPETIFSQTDEYCATGTPIDLRGAYAIAVRNDTVYVTGRFSNNVLKKSLATPDACVEVVVQDGGEVNLEGPQGLAVDPSGNVYVTGRNSDNVFWITADGTVTEIANQQNGLDDPRGVVVDGAGDVYVSSAESSNAFRVRTIREGETCGNGIVDAGEECDYSFLMEPPDSPENFLREGCCCSVACTLKPAGAVCGRTLGVCDREEICDGESTTCPIDDVTKREGEVCRPSQGPCDVEERCVRGASMCPQDTFAANGLTCRPELHSCDEPEMCTGGSAQCPADALSTTGTECAPPTACAAEGRCDRAGACVALPKDDGVSCGNLCEHMVCAAGDCIPNPTEPHPCGGGASDRCDATQVGRECTNCGRDGVQPQFGEECDDGNDIEDDGCSRLCKKDCDASDPAACPARSPCLPRACVRVDRTKGNRCVDVPAPGCRVCTNDAQCVERVDSCMNSVCVVVDAQSLGTCRDTPKSGAALATCDFQRQLDTATLDDCANDSKQQARVLLKRLKRLDQRARGAVELSKIVACDAAERKRARRLYHRSIQLLDRVTLEATAARSPFRAVLSNECANAVVAVMTKRRGNLAEVKKLRGFPAPLCNARPLFENGRAAM